MNIGGDFLIPFCTLNSTACKWAPSFSIEETKSYSHFCHCTVWHNSSKEQRTEIEAIFGDVYAKKHVSHTRTLVISRLQHSADATLIPDVSTCKLLPTGSQGWFSGKHTSTGPGFKLRNPEKWTLILIKAPRTANIASVVWTKSSGFCKY